MIALPPNMLHVQLSVSLLSLAATFVLVHAYACMPVLTVTVIVTVILL